MSYQAHQAALVARTVLALNRPVGPTSATARAVDMLREHTTRVWYDPIHRFDAGDTAAFRAVDDSGRFCWLVRAHGERILVSHTTNPYDAIAAANDWPAPDAVLPWAEVQELARALRRREIRFRLAPADFEGLAMPFAWLMRTGMPGWAAAWLLPVSPALGSAIWTAHRRTLGERRARPTALAVA